MNKGKRSTLKTIAEKVGVSVTTVSRVLNEQSRRYRISQKTENTIREAATMLHYTPDLTARGLRLKRKQCIGLAIPDISNPFFSSIAKSIAMEARISGYSVMLCDSQENTELEIDCLQQLLGRVDGLIVCPVGQKSDHIAQLVDKDVPIVVVDRYFPELNYPYVIADNYQGALDAVSHMIENGHRSIAYIQGLVDTSPNSARLRGYKDGHKRFNVPLDESMIVGDSFEEQNGYISAKLLLRRSVKPTAIFAVSNLISIGAMRAIAEDGYKIPADISIISFDEQPHSNLLSTPMTTVAQPQSEMGHIAVKILLDWIEKKNVNAEGVILPTKLIRRQSVKNISKTSAEVKKNGMVTNQLLSPRGGDKLHQEMFVEKNPGNQ